MHLFSQPRDPLLPIFFNVDTSVGNQGQNSNQEDILLVQFLIKKTSTNATLQPDTQARMRKVPVTGRVDATTIDGIRAVQEHMRRKFAGTVVDGRISPARGLEYGPGFWTIVTLNRATRQQFPQVWPRLQDFPDCPATVRRKVPTLL